MGANMEVKTFEIRDRGTFIPVVAIQLRPQVGTQDAYLCGRVGIGEADYKHGLGHILLFNLQTGKGFLDPYDWAGSPYVRTLPTAHIYLKTSFNTLKSGSVIDIEFIIGETEKPKISERENG